MALCLWEQKDFSNETPFTPASFFTQCFYARQGLKFKTLLLDNSILGSYLSLWAEIQHRGGAVCFSAESINHTLSHGQSLGLVSVYPLQGIKIAYFTELCQKKRGTCIQVLLKEQARFLSKMSWFRRIHIINLHSLLRNVTLFPQFSLRGTDDGCGSIHLAVHRAPIRAWVPQLSVSYCLLSKIEGKCFSRDCFREQGVLSTKQLSGFIPYIFMHFLLMVSQGTLGLSRKVFQLDECTYGFEKNQSDTSPTIFNGQAGLRLGAILLREDSAFLKDRSSHTLFVCFYGSN